VATETPKSLSILRDACARNGVAFTVLDGFSGFVARITKGTKSCLVGAAGVGVYPINRAAPFAIARDKAFTHYVLKQAGFSVPIGEHFFLHPPGPQYDRPPGRERSDAIRYAGKISDGFARPLVVKPNGGKGAKLVAFVRDQPGLNAALDRIAAIDEIALVQSFLDAPEFRLFLIDGEIAFAYAKLRATIRGDSTTPVRILLGSLSRPGPELGVSFADSLFFRSQLAERGLTLDSVLAAGTDIPVDFVSNISAGGQFAGFLEPREDLKHWARNLAQAVSLRVTGIDIFSPSKLANVDDIVVIDVNGSPNLGTLFELGHRDLVFGVWQTILSKTFDEPWPEGF
jgi:glutathione synthase/RimK-type ligase-like ATP-grasp enzyme